MKTTTAQKRRTKPLVLSKRTEEILRTIYFYRYMTALDVAHLLYSPSSLTHVRSILSDLAGGMDYMTHRYLYRFPMPSTTTGNRERIFTLGSKGRDYLAHEVGLPVNWYFRPQSMKHLGYGLVMHNLALTRFLVAAHRWASRQPDFRLVETRIGYDLAKIPPSVTLTEQGKTVSLKVIFDAWLLFERLKNGAHDTFFPIALEIDRGHEFRDKLKRHVASRIELIRSGTYTKLFNTQAVTIAYATFGDTPQYRDSRLNAMRKWTMEVLKEKHKETWAGIFRFTSLSPDDIYSGALFSEPLWYRPDSPEPVPLFSG